MPTDTSSKVPARLAALRRRLGEHAPALGGVLVTEAENRRYLSGFAGSAGQLLVSQAAGLLLTDFRYVEQAATQAPGCEVVKTEGHAWPFVAEQIARLGLKQIGFEAEHVTVDQHLRLQEALREKAPGAELVPLRGFAEDVRQVKDPSEVEAIRRAVLISDRALEHVVAGLMPGVTEREVAWRLEVAMRERGADALSFPTIVASGPNGAMPHHRASERPIQAGEPIVIDMGCRLNGYCSDMTRTVVLGDPDPMFWEIHAIVLRAQQACEDGLKAGMLGKEGDMLARKVIEDAGHGDHFGHGTGHGIGLAVHEDPYLSRSRGEMMLRAGAVTSVEPGIYLPGWGGIRIEDLVVIGETRCQVLTTAHKAPVVEIGAR
ncbi:MAG: Aminopeptidase YpdF (MP-, MA-, MS-, AP-, NP-specific) [uncultured Chloroflexi bacterium]|uniref:Aminopeptidase YpdF (MP-, MA-, MS-, AP-, NP-specific) n=1 Tax=uncultured Chloroflexota bacterium TaxID=166587 RepID=A0A6J4JT78_9CHLR|nr:MAG: Aminopeptidase YpdF (MP-, MA-, MS-, AP-, NP-specific) [uncultured Chloroflexota bacterium]